MFGITFEDTEEPATVVSAAWLNAVQGLLDKIMTDAGLSPYVNSAAAIADSFAGLSKSVVGTKWNIITFPALTVSGGSSSPSGTPFFSYAVVANNSTTIINFHFSGTFTGTVTSFQFSIPGPGSGSNGAFGCCAVKYPSGAGGLASIVVEGNLVTINPIGAANFTSSVTYEFIGQIVVGKI